ncbi:MAG TPA: hypothetical protein VIW26_15215 [Gemmatimonadales bacterium]
MLGRDAEGNVMLQPGEPAGTKAVVLGLACARNPDGAWTPRETGSAVVQVKVVVSRLPSGFTPITRNVADGGNVKHCSKVVRTPRSMDQNPPGVRG